MEVSVESGDAARAAVDALAVPLLQAGSGRRRLPPPVAALDRTAGGRIRAVLESGDFRGRSGECVVLYPDGSLAARRLILVGMGSEEEAGEETLRRAAGHAVQQAAGRRAESLALLVPSLRRLRAPAAAQALAEGAVLADYRFDAYRSRRENGSARVESATLLFERGADARAARSARSRGVVLAESQNIARRLSNEPGNAMPPVALEREARRIARDAGLRFRSFGVPELRRRAMGGILAVGQGSANQPRLIVLEHNAPASSSRPRARGGRRRRSVCLVGKGITFDSGGISIKPSGGMQDMKHDMSGGAAVIAALRAAALLRVPFHVVGIVAAAENLPGSTAYRPGDIVTTASGQTIEVLNTDAEGRVVLSDALHFARSEYEPEAIVDVATLTGACVVALGKWASAVLGNDERLVDRVRAAGEATGERVWPLPLWSEHREFVRSRIADVKNASGRDGGTITAAAFLSHFTEGTPWAHLDIAGTGWTDKGGPYQPPGATGVGVRLLLELLRTWGAGRGSEARSARRRV